MQEYIITEIDNTCDAECLAQEFIRKIKVAVINLKTLHRNLKSGGSKWFQAHQILDNYTWMLNQAEDRIVENLIGLGIKDKSIKGSDDILEAKDYTEEEALDIVIGMFRDLLSLSMSVREALKESTGGASDLLAPVFDEFENTLHLEANYKLTKALDKEETFNGK